MVLAIIYWIEFNIQQLAQGSFKSTDPVAATVASTVMFKLHIYMEMDKKIMLCSIRHCIMVPILSPVYIISSSTQIVYVMCDDLCGNGTQSSEIKWAFYRT